MSEMRKNQVLFYREKRGLGVPRKMDVLLRKTVDEAVFWETGRRDFTVCITYTDDEGIRVLNWQHRKMDRPTDVLSFPMLPFNRGEPCFRQEERDPDTGRFYLGDIVLSVDRIAAQSAEFGHSIDREAAFLAVHSVLHLLGYDHVDNDEGREEMEQKQREVLERLGLTREAPAQIFLQHTKLEKK